MSHLRNDLFTISSWITSRLYVYSLTCTCWIEVSDIFKTTHRQFRTQVLHSIYPIYTLNILTKFMDTFVVLLICLQHFLDQLLPNRGHGTYTAGTVNSIALLKVGRNSIDFPSHFWWPNVVKMHKFASIFSKNFSGITPRPQKLGTGNPSPQTLPPRQAPTVPLFQSFRGYCCEIL